MYIQWNPAKRPPLEYDHLVITAHFFGPGKTPIDFLIKIPR